MAENEQLTVQEARAGEPGAWEILFRRYQLPLYTYVSELVRHEQTSLDIVQETFINAAGHIRSLQLSDGGRCGGLRKENIGLADRAINDLSSRSVIGHCCARDGTLSGQDL